MTYTRALSRALKSKMVIISVISLLVGVGGVLAVGFLRDLEAQLTDLQFEVRDLEYERRDLEYKLDSLQSQLLELEHRIEIQMIEVEDRLR